MKCEWTAKLQGTQGVHPLVSGPRQDWIRPEADTSAVNQMTKKTEENNTGIHSPEMTVGRIEMSVRSTDLMRMYWALSHDWTLMLFVLLITIVLQEVMIAMRGKDKRQDKRQETNMTKTKEIQEGVHSLPSTSEAEGGDSNPKRQPQEIKRRMS